MVRRKRWLFVNPTLPVLRLGSLPSHTCAPQWHDMWQDAHCPSNLVDDGALMTGHSRGILPTGYNCCRQRCLCPLPASAAVVRGCLLIDAALWRCAVASPTQQGIAAALCHMCRGEKAEVKCTPEYGYGAKGTPEPLPADEQLGLGGFCCALRMRLSGIAATPQAASHFRRCPRMRISPTKSSSLTGRILRTWR